MKREELNKKIELLDEKLDELFSKLKGTTIKDAYPIMNEINELKERKEILLESLPPDFTDGIIDLYQTPVINKREKDYLFAITKHNEKNKIGEIEIRVNDDPIYGNIGYYIIKTERGNNYTLRALILLREFFIKVGLEKPKFTVLDTNIPSNIVIKKFGGYLIKTTNTDCGNQNIYEVDLKEQKEDRIIK